MVEALLGDEFSVQVMYYSFGNNEYGQLFDVDRKSRDMLPQPIDATTKLEGSKACCGRHHTMLLTTDGKVYTAGNGARGQLGIGDITDKNPKEEINAVRKLASKKIKQIYAAADTSYCVDDEGRLHAWGSGRYGSLAQGLRRTKDIPVPVQIPRLKYYRVAHMACGDHFVIMATDRDKIFVWGRNREGQLGLGHQRNVHSPTRWPWLMACPPKQFAAGRYHVLMLTETKEGDVLGMIDDPLTPIPVVFAWGDNTNGQLGVIRTKGFSDRASEAGKRLGRDDLVDESESKVIGGEEKKVYVARGIKAAPDKVDDGAKSDDDHEDDAVPLKRLVAGRRLSMDDPDDRDAVEGNYRGIIGIGRAAKRGEPQYKVSSEDGTKALVPQLVTRLNGMPITQIAAGGWHSLALTKKDEAPGDSVIWGWGQNKYGQVGVGDTTDRDIPTVLMTIKNMYVHSISAGLRSSAAVNEKGILYTWGNGFNGETGHGRKPMSLIPTAVETMKVENLQVRTIDIGDYHAVTTSCSVAEQIAANARAARVLAAKMAADARMKAAEKLAAGGGGGFGLGLGLGMGRKGSTASSLDLSVGFGGGGGDDEEDADELGSGAAWKRALFEVADPTYCSLHVGRDPAESGYEYKLRLSCKPCNLKAICRACARKCHASHHVTHFVEKVRISDACNCGERNTCRSLPPEEEEEEELVL